MAPVPRREAGQGPTLLRALALHDHKIRCVQLADRGVDEIDRPCAGSAAQGEHGPAMPIALQRAHDVGDGVVVADAACEVDDAERIITKSGDRIDLVAGVDKYVQARAVVADADVGGAIDERLIAKPDKVELV